jgi:hypothetical protein
MSDVEKGLSPTADVPEDATVIGSSSSADFKGEEPQRRTFWEKFQYYNHRMETLMGIEAVSRGCDQGRSWADS